MHGVESFSHFTNGFHPVGVASGYHNREGLGCELKSPDADHRLNAKNTETEHPSSVKNPTLIVL
jgi:hypothetical protein